MVNYRDGKLYKLWSPLGDKIYVGGTAMKYLSRREALHKNSYKRKDEEGHRGCSSYELFDLYGVDNVEIELIRSFPCRNVYELRAGEEVARKELEAFCVNKIRAYQTRAEAVQRSKEYKRNYAEANKEICQERIKKWASSRMICECGHDIARGSKRYHVKSKYHLSHL